MKIIIEISCKVINELYYVLQKNKKLKEIIKILLIPIYHHNF